MLLNIHSVDVSMCCRIKKPMYSIISNSLIKLPRLRDNNEVKTFNQVRQVIFINKQKACELSVIYTSD